MSAAAPLGRTWPLVSSCRPRALAVHALEGLRLWRWIDAVGPAILVGAFLAVVWLVCLGRAACDGSFYDSLAEGAPACLRVHPGALKLPWLSVRSACDGGRALR